MALIDREGRLFARINLVDLCALVVAVVLVPAAWALYASVRTRAVQITAVRPRTLTIGSPMRVEIEGTRFRSDLRAFASRTGQRAGEAEESARRARLAFTSPSRLELQFPEMPPGTYDVHLTDRGRIVATFPAALTVSQPSYPRGVRTMTVRLYPPPESVSLIRVGDTDIVEPRQATSLVIEPAVVTAVNPTPERREVVDMHMTREQDTWFGQPMLGQAVVITLRVPVVELRPGGWSHGDESLSVGGLYVLTTDRYRFRGVITSMGEVERITSPGP